MPRFSEAMDRMTPTELKQARRKLGLTQSELGKLLDVGGRMIRAMEAGHRRIDKAKAAAVLFGTGYRPDDWPS